MSWLSDKAAAILAAAAAILFLLLFAEAKLEAAALGREVDRQRRAVSAAEAELAICKADQGQALAALGRQTVAVRDLEARAKADTAAAQRLASEARRSAEARLAHAAAVMKAEGSTCADADALILDSLGDGR